jgi:hypothetical protein
VRTAIIRLPFSPYEARSLLTLDLSLGMEDRETRRGAIRGFVVDDDRVWDVLTRQGYSPLLVSYLFVGNAEARLIRGMA